MKKFMDENFLLNNDTAINLYNKYAKNQPIIDFHCHVSPQEIYEEKKLKTLLKYGLVETIINDALCVQMELMKNILQETQAIMINL